ncbi:MAG: response regulator [Bacteroidales bacterium]|nr:response regulator [Bacteroidales bacterium]
MLKRLLLSVLLCALGHTAAMASWANGYRYSYYGIQEGLCDEYVTSTFKDSRGFLWICTSNGLDRFDGARFVHFSSRSENPSTRIGSDFVYCAAEDSHGRIWTASNGGLSCIDYKGGKILSPSDMGDGSGLLSKPMIWLIWDGDILWALERNGLKRVSLDSSGNISEVKFFPSMSSALRFFALQGDRVWVGGSDGVECFRKGGERILSPENGSVYPELSSLKNVSTILSDGDYLWIGTEDGLFCYNTAHRSLESFRHKEGDVNSLSDDHVTCLASEGAGDILIGTTKGIDKYMRNGRFGHISEGKRSRSLNTGYVNHIFRSDDGTLWVSTLVGGVNEISPRTVSFEDLLSVTEGSKNIISCIYEDRNGNLLMGILGKGLGIRYAGEESVHVWSLKERGGLSQEDIFEIRQDIRGDYWMASRNDGLVYIKGSTLKDPSFSAYDAANSDLGSNVIGDLEYDPVRDRIWLCMGTGLEMVDPATMKVRDVPLFREEDRQMRFNCLYLEKDRLFVGGTGLVSIDLDTVSFSEEDYRYFRYRDFPPEGSSGQGRINSIVTGRNGEVYVGSQNDGIFIASEDGNFSPLPLRYGEFRRRISQLLTDEKGDLWIGTTQGVYHYTASTGYLSRFAKEDGLPSTYCYVDSGTGLADGRVCFGTANGALLFNTPAELLELKGYKVSITGIVHDNHLDLGDVGQRLDIRPGFPSFEVHFSSMDLSDPDNVRYAYKLEPLDEDWTATQSGAIGYSNLKPGQYSLRIRCTLGPDDTEGEEAVLPIKVHRPFYKAFWFWMILASLMLSGLIYILSLRYREQRRIRKMLQAEVEDRTADLKKALQDILESKESIEKQNLLLEEQKVKLQQYADRIENANREKMMFYTNMTHEFKTPLSLIIGPSSELVSTVKDHNLMPSLQMINRNAKYLLSLVNQILNLRKVDSGNVRTEKEVMNISLLPDNITLDFDRTFKERGIVFRKYTHLMGNHILSDRENVSRMLSNLISNAVKYTPSGGEISLYMAHLPSGDGTGAVQYISVFNSGSYIPPSEREKIFECFYKIPGSHPDPSSGQSSSGVGLYIVKQIITNMGGKILVKSVQGHGTSFRLLFPVGIVPAETEDTSENLQYVLPQDDTVPVLLLVEDNPDMRTYIKDILKGKFNIAEASDGLAGYELAKKIIPDFIISDLMMPGCDGVQLCRMIRSDSTLSHVPFMMLTALSDDSARLESYKGGVDAFLVKPFEKEMLLTRIDNLFSLRRERQSELSFDLSNAYANVDIENPDKAFMRNLMTIMKENYADPEFSVPQLQSRMCMSMTPFYKKISALTGLTPALFIRLYRLQTAKKILESHRGDSGISVSEVAYMVGFNDPKYFSKCFHKQFHTIPSSILQESE